MQLHRPKHLLTALLLWLVPGCPDGKDPPAPTPTVGIGSGTYVLGSPATACKQGGSGLQSCDVLDSAKPHNKWVDNNTWTPLATAHLDGFGMEEHEVTNDQYRYCEESGKCTAPAAHEVGGVEYYGNDAYDEHPVVNVSWTQAEAYCTFVGRKLPTEAQWEVAARMTKGGKMTTFPRSDTVVPSCNADSDSYLVHSACGIKAPLAKKSSARDATQRGVRDMASNVSEWVRDAWNPWAYCEEKKNGHSPDCQSDPRGPGCARSCDPQKLVLCKAGVYQVNEGSKVGERVVRGGSYASPVCHLRLFVRRMAPPDPSPTIGFRCVKEGAGPDAGVSPKDTGVDSSVDSSVPDAGGE